MQRLHCLMLAAYSALLQRRPLITKGCSAGLLFSLGDFLAQRLETAELDSQRLMAFGSYGASWYAISQHYWFAWMERHVACGWSPSGAAVARVAAHSAVFAPFSIVSLFGWMAITTGRSWQELQDICHPEAIFRMHFFLRPSSWSAGFQLLDDHIQGLLNLHHALVHDLNFPPQLLQLTVLRHHRQRAFLLQIQGICQGLCRG